MAFWAIYESRKQQSTPSIMSDMRTAARLPSPYRYKAKELQVKQYFIVSSCVHICRYLSHFRSVHRGAYFAELRTTTVRKLLPESWGFLCPVHTPDGSPCGLLNHFTAACRIVTEPSESAEETRTAVAQARPAGLLPCNEAYTESNIWLLCQTQLIACSNPTAQHWQHFCSLPSSRILSKRKTM